jgi:hypothetical protein
LHKEGIAIRALPADEFTGAEIPYRQPEPMRQEWIPAGRRGEFKTITVDPEDNPRQEPEPATASSRRS